MNNSGLLALEINIMFRTNISGLALAATFVASIAGTASADEPSHALPQLASITTDLGNKASALTYWVDEADGIHVVTTIDTIVAAEAGLNAERHAVVRFSALILPGQSQVISVPGPVGSPQQALRIRRLSNQSGGFRVEVERIPGLQVRAQASSAATKG
jgi:hypothetical protein